MKVFRSKTFKRLTALFLAMAVLCSGAVLAYIYIDVYKPASEDVENIRRQIREERFIIHAGGYLPADDGETVRLTNSCEGLINLWENGHRICEIDIRLTTDGVPVCAHETNNSFAKGTDLPAEASSEEFLSAKIYGRYTPMTVDYLAGFMRAHPELLVITDIKDDNVGLCRILAETYPELKDQFIIQIYHYDEYDPIRALGFRYIIYTMYRAYRLESSVINLCRFAGSHELVGYTFSYNVINSPRWRYGIRKTGVPYMLHTVNDRDAMDQYLEQELCIGIYTDQT